MLKNGTRLWREAHLQVKMLKNRRCRSHLGSSDVEKWHAAVARSTFVRQNVQNTSAPESVGAILEVPMLKNGTRLWREPHLCVKNVQNASRDPEKWRAAVARSTFSSQNRKKLTGSHHFLKVRCRKMARRCGAKHICTSPRTNHLLFAAFSMVSHRLTN